MSATRSRPSPLPANPSPSPKASLDGPSPPQSPLVPGVSHRGSRKSLLKDLSKFLQNHSRRSSLSKAPERMPTAAPVSPMADQPVTPYLDPYPSTTMLPSSSPHSMSIESISSPPSHPSTPSSSTSSLHPTMTPDSQSSPMAMRGVLPPSVLASEGSERRGSLSRLGRTLTRKLKRGRVASDPDLDLHNTHPGRVSTGSNPSSTSSLSEPSETAAVVVPEPMLSSIIAPAPLPGMAPMRTSASVAVIMAKPEPRKNRSAARPPPPQQLKLVRTRSHGSSLHGSGGGHHVVSKSSARVRRWLHLDTSKMNPAMSDAQAMTIVRPQQTPPPSPLLRPAQRMPVEPMAPLESLLPEPRPQTVVEEQEEEEEVEEDPMPEVRPRKRYSEDISKRPSKIPPRSSSLPRSFYPGTTPASYKRRSCELTVLEGEGEEEEEEEYEDIAESDMIAEEDEEEENHDDRHRNESSTNSDPSHHDLLLAITPTMTTTKTAQELTASIQGSLPAPTVPVEEKEEEGQETTLSPNDTSSDSTPVLPLLSVTGPEGVVLDPCANDDMDAGQDNGDDEDETLSEVEHEDDAIALLETTRQAAVAAEVAAHVAHQTCEKELVPVQEMGSEESHRHDHHPRKQSISRKKHHPADPYEHMDRESRKVVMKRQQEHRGQSPRTSSEIDVAARCLGEEAPAVADEVAAAAAVLVTIVVEPRSGTSMRKTTTRTSSFGSDMDLNEDFVSLEMSTPWLDNSRREAQRPRLEAPPPVLLLMPPLRTALVDPETVRNLKRKTLATAAESDVTASSPTAPESPIEVSYAVTECVTEDQISITVEEQETTVVEESMAVLDTLPFPLSSSSSASSTCSLPSMMTLKDDGDEEDKHNPFDDLFEMSKEVDHETDEVKEETDPQVGVLQTLHQMYPKAAMLWKGHDESRAACQRLFFWNPETSS
ncbi:hypothetical protein BGW38_005834 [Lunasporangiospora selenospora]|uniref:Uncharacterized protein n=1 Tax=Lunasporangiospora selenospora TaxID=979761 RepID=A0A9P6FPF8_9FUNG|nr:hypothetical protein BGW38_005834 [Lunasporangiospora selenospora]